jgi:phosphatidylinositol alpha-1,6-mannosyltransferase
MAEPSKGHDVMLRALPLIRARLPQVQWVVIGDGPLRPRYERMAHAFGVSEQVRFVGALQDDERDSWFDAAHLFAMPSRLSSTGGGEGFGIVYLEAAAHNLPVVAGNVGGAVEAVLDGVTGVLVDPTDHLAVADAITDLLLDPKRAERLGRAGAARVPDFSWCAVSRRVEQLVMEVATGRTA